MNIIQRKEAFTKLGNWFINLNEEDLAGIVFKAHAENPWFNAQSILEALNGLGEMLSESEIERFCKQYYLTDSVQTKIGIVMAGNIPAVGFHDLMIVLLAGAKAVIKFSSQDKEVMMFILNKLIEIEPAFAKCVTPTLRMNLDELDGVIATGSDNTARYFEQYFGRIPNIIRKNRSSIAVLTGDETDEELDALGKDVFRYYGLGCRNVSKLLVPTDFDMVHLLDHLQPEKYVQYHSKFDNNYTYYKSIFLVNGDEHLDTGYSLFKPDDRLVSPISVVFYQKYDSLENVNSYIEENEEKIQCVVGKNYIPFGQAQSPIIDDYADGVDTMQFVLGL